MKSKYQCVGAQLSVFPLSDRLTQMWPTFLCRKITVTGSNLGRLYILYGIYCLLYSDLFVQVQVVSSECLISPNEKYCEPERDLCSRETELLATLSFVLLLACLSGCVPALFRALIISLLHLRSRKVLSLWEVKKKVLIGLKIYVKLLSLILLERK